MDIVNFLSSIPLLFCISAKDLLPCMGNSQKWFQGMLLFGLVASSPLSRAEEPTDTIWPPPDQIATATHTLLLTSQYHNNFTPAFHTESRSALLSSAALLWRAHPDLCLLGAISSPATPEDGAALRWGAELTLYRTPGWRIGIGWRASLPLQPLTNETHITPLVRVTLHPAVRPDADLTLSLGLAILGDPLRTASQDDVPLSWLSLAWPLREGSPWWLRGRAGGGWPSARSPARMEAALGLGWQGASGFSLGAEGSGGLSPAAADRAAGLWVGWQAPSP